MTLLECFAKEVDFYSGGQISVDAESIKRYIIVREEPAGVFTMFPPEYPEILSTYETTVEYYIGRSGNKQVSPLYRTLVETEPLTLPSQILNSILINKFGKKWLDSYNFISQDLDVDKEYTEKISKTGTDSHVITNDDIITDDGQVGSKVTTDYSDGVAGFNSPSYVNDTRSTRTETANSNDNTNHNTRTVNADHTDDLTYGSVVTKEGRNAPKARLMNEALKFKRDNLFLDMVFKDIDSVLTLPIYM